MTNEEANIIKDLLDLATETATTYVDLARKLQAAQSKLAEKVAKISEQVIQLR